MANLAFNRELAKNQSTLLTIRVFQYLIDPEVDFYGLSANQVIRQGQFLMELASADGQWGLTESDPGNSNQEMRIRLSRLQARSVSF